MHPNIKFITPPAPGPLPAMSLNEFLDLPSPPLPDSNVKYCVAETLGNISLQEYIRDAPSSFGIEEASSRAKETFQRSQIARVPGLSEIGEGNDHILHQRVHIVSPPGASDEGEHRLMMLMIPAIEKVISAVDDDGLVAISNSLDENWGDILPKNNPNAVKVKAVLARRGYEITKAAIEKGSLYLSIYKKEFTGFMKMALPSRKGTYLSVPTQSNLQNCGATKGFLLGSVSAVSRHQHGKDRPRLRASATSENLRVLATQSPTPLYPKAARMLRPSSSTTDLGRYDKRLQNSPSVGKKTLVTMESTVIDSHHQRIGSNNVRCKSSPPRLHTISMKCNPSVKRGVRSVASVADGGSGDLMSVINLRQCAPEDVDQRRAMALTGMMAFGEALLTKVDKDNEAYLSERGPPTGDLPTPEESIGGFSKNLPGTPLGIENGHSNVIERGRVKNSETVNFDTTVYRSGTTISRAASNASGGIRRPLDIQHRHSKNSVDLTREVHSVTRARTATGSVGDIRRGDPRATTSSLKRQNSVSSVLKRHDSQRYGRDIKWN